MVSIMGCTILKFSKFLIALRFLRWLEIFIIFYLYKNLKYIPLGFESLRFLQGTSYQVSKIVCSLCFELPLTLINSLMQSGVLKRHLYIQILISRYINYSMPSIAIIWYGNMIYHVINICTLLRNSEITKRCLLYKIYWKKSMLRM